METKGGVIMAGEPILPWLGGGEERLIFLMGLTDKAER